MAAEENMIASSGIGDEDMEILYVGRTSSMYPFFMRSTVMRTTTRFTVMDVISQELRCDGRTSSTIV